MKKKTAEAYVRGRTVQEHIAEQMKYPEFKKAWHDLDSESELLESLLKAREKAGLTQEELAEKIGTKQPALSRLERGGFKKASVETLRKIADVLDARLVIKLQPKKVNHPAVR
ncbi:MAG: helix-turn-helix transcriptional regulator [Nitrospirae bacterium]|nr:helix-turn-helix transcriptional regulator [Nitrospirota bacterium]MBA3071907.1 helix-turn-helix transcriptional regulator [Nitrospirota bacterium]